MTLDDLHRQLAELHRGRAWILTADAAAAATDLVKQLQQWGAAGVMVVSATEGVGELPEGVPIHYTRTQGPTIMKGFRAFFAALADPSPELVAALEEFDPGGSALMLAPPFGELADIAGRKVYGAREPSWGALEDKMIADEIWDAAHIPRAPSEVVPVEVAPRAAARLADALGTVWVADNTEGWHGGGDYTRWVSGPAATRDAQLWFSDHAERVRVMPFLDGLPCSIHGFVTAGGVATFRPVEIVILRRSDRLGLVYAGAATLWDPPADIREEMRTVARAVAAELQRRVDYRGPFGVDGVCTSEGFRPTELNPRLSAGLGIQARTADVPLGSLTRAFLAGDLEVEASWLEEVVVAGADAQRMGGMGLPISAQITPAETGIVFTDSEARAVGIDDEHDASMEAGSSGSGSYIRMRLDLERIPSGRSVAPYAAQAANLAASMWSFDLPPVEPAPDLCQ